MRFCFARTTSRSAALRATPRKGSLPERRSTIHGCHRHQKPLSRSVPFLEEGERERREIRADVPSVPGFLERRMTLVSLLVTDIFSVRVPAVPVFWERLIFGGGVPDFWERFLHWFGAMQKALRIFC